VFEVGVGVEVEVGVEVGVEVEVVVVVEVDFLLELLKGIPRLVVYGVYLSPQVLKTNMQEEIQSLSEMVLESLELSTISGRECLTEYVL
jgi:hypothetical protein